ncbi:RNA polymerase sigma factor [Chitinophaga sp. CB10]|uniref:RNA polymerase sigma factor n=1 Tax=Chitinophaga sp. CB10 TaxID=1891659 RepID=UPI0025BC835F|nr:RNA polymerase sigma factor [Chitinophaga sp. CB10]
MELYEQYGPTIYGRLVKALRDEECAADLLQETFIKVWQGLDTYDAALSKITTWISAIAGNTAKDYWRSKYYRQKQQTLSLDGQEDELPLQDGISNLEWERVAPHLKNDHSAIINMLFFEGYSLEEYAEINNIPFETAKSRKYSAIRKLRKLFGLGY